MCEATGPFLSGRKRLRKAAIRRRNDQPQHFAALIKWQSYKYSWRGYFRSWAKKPQSGEVAFLGEDFEHQLRAAVRLTCCKAFSNSELGTPSVQDR